MLNANRLRIMMMQSRRGRQLFFLHRFFQFFTNSRPPLLAKPLKSAWSRCQVEFLLSLANIARLHLHIIKRVLKLFRIRKKPWNFFRTRYSSTQSRLLLLYCDTVAELCMKKWLLLPNVNISDRPVLPHLLTDEKLMRLKGGLGVRRMAKNLATGFDGTWSPSMHSA